MRMNERRSQTGLRRHTAQEGTRHANCFFRVAGHQEPNRAGNPREGDNTLSVKRYASTRKTKQIGGGAKAWQQEENTAWLNHFSVSIVASLAAVNYHLWTHMC